MKQQLTWNKETKAHWVKIMQGHQDADRFIQGRWHNPENNKGCFFGCAMQTEEDPLGKAIKEMHLPGWVVYLGEKIHERLPQKESKLFPLILCQAIPEDTDIRQVEFKLIILRLRPLAEKNPSVADVINGVITCCEIEINGGSPDWARAADMVDRAADMVAARADMAARAARAADRAYVTARAAMADRAARADMAAMAAMADRAAMAADMAYVAAMTAMAADRVADMADMADMAARAADRADMAARAAMAAMTADMADMAADRADRADRAARADRADRAAMTAMAARAMAANFWITERDNLINLLKEAS